MVHETSEEKLHADLWEARRAELVVRSGTLYKFMRDRIREAAYSLIPRKERAHTSE
jgi:predicted ATPase